MPLRNVLRRALSNRWLRNPWVAGVALLALSVALAFEVVALSDEESLPEAPSETVEVVRNFAVAVTNFDHRRIDADIKRLLSYGTPGFAQEFRSDLGPDFATTIKSRKRVSTGRIDAGPTLQRITADRATFLVIINQRVSSAGQEPLALRVGMVVTVDRKAEKVDSVRRV